MPPARPDLPWRAAVARWAAMDPLAAVLVLAGLLLAVLVGYALAAARRSAAPAADAAAVDRLQETLEQRGPRPGRAAPRGAAGPRGRARGPRGRRPGPAGAARAGAARARRGEGPRAGPRLAARPGHRQPAGGSSSWWPARAAAGRRARTSSRAPSPSCRPTCWRRTRPSAAASSSTRCGCPAGASCPIDSKWTGVAELERLETTDDPDERRRLREQVAREVRLRAREMAKYLDPERTLALAVLAVPDAVHAEAPEAHAEGWREGVLVVPYSLALPFVLSLYRLDRPLRPRPRHGGGGRRASRGSRSCCSGWTTRSRGGSPAPSSRRRTPATPCAATWPRPAARAGRLAGFDRPRAEG